MSKWTANAIIVNNKSVRIADAEITFELKDREQYKRRHMRELAKIVALDAEHEYNKNHCTSKCILDLRTVKSAHDDAELNYFPKSDYLEISIMTK